jgi:hypothetical protein
MESGRVIASSSSLGMFLCAPATHQAMQDIIKILIQQGYNNCNLVGFVPLI